MQWPPKLQMLHVFFQDLEPGGASPKTLAEMP